LPPHCILFRPAVQLEDVVVTGQCTEATRGYTALQVGCTTPRAQRVSKPASGLFASLGLPPKMHLAEFHVTPDALLPVGTPLLAQHFMPGQFVNVQGVTQGKGFQGAMKRHGFGGQPASHGNSVSHRALGATGCRQDPGRVMKGKKMPGHMGEDTLTVECLRVYKLDLKRGLVYLKGAVPGKPGALAWRCTRGGTGTRRGWPGMCERVP
jgi:large subunit ribosomal protein L3